MHRCPDCAGSDTPGWRMDREGEPCERCSLPTQIGGSGWLYDNGFPVPIEDAHELMR